MLASALAAAALLVPALAAPAPIPSGGVGVRANDTPPIYHTMSDFDFQSLNLALNQEWIELDLFNYAVARFSEGEWASQGINEEGVSLIRYFAQQEVGHAELLSNIVSYANRTGAKQCEYKYNFNTVQEFINFAQQLTRWGESGVYGFLSHLDSRPSANLLVQSIATEARQQFALRQFAGAFPVPVYFETGISQSMTWSLLSPYLVSCPAENPRIEWNIFPALNVTNQESLIVDGYNASISHNRTSLTEAGRVVSVSWEAPGKAVSYNSSYNTTVGGLVNTTTPLYAAWISQLNVTYTPLNLTSDWTATTIQPGGYVFNDTTDSVVNGTMFLGLTTTDLYVTPYNLSRLDDVLVAFGIYQAD
ncbi:hypothetical protein Q5752_005239 [Cryptotrichosporon argae]